MTTTPDMLEPASDRVDQLAGHLEQLVGVVGALADRQERILEELRAYTSTVVPWRDHVIGFHGETRDGFARLRELEELDRSRFELLRAQVDKVAGTLPAVDFLLARAQADARATLERRDADLPLLRERLEEVRATAAYEEAFTAAEPLITVPIATYKRPVALVETAIASVLRQTYQNFEIVVVSDGPSDETRQAVASVDDARIRYHELPAKTVMPKHRRNRWLVAGAAPKNEAVRLASGSWIAQLDDDDEFTPDHLATLLRLARQQRAELAYGMTVQHNVNTGRTARIWSDPPVEGGFSFLGALYHRALGFLEYDEAGWLTDEPEDWRLVRRMLAIGVRHAATRDVVGTMHTDPDKAI